MTTVKYSSEMVHRVNIYFAHPAILYGTQDEDRALALIGYQFPHATIENPYTPDHERAVADYKAAGRPSMDHFVAVIRASCDALVFMAFTDGMISSSVSLEIETAHMAGLPLWEIVAAVPSWYIRSVVFDLPLSSRFLTREETLSRVWRTETLSFKG